MFIRLREGLMVLSSPELEQTRGHTRPQTTRSFAMRPFQGKVWGCALAALAVATVSAVT